MKSGLSLLLLLLLLPRSSQAQPDCCYCKDVQGHIFASATVAGLGDCRITCAANGGSFTGRRERCPERPSLPSELFQNVGYSIWHQGAVVWTGSDQGTLLGGEPLRYSLMGGQTDFQHGQRPAYEQIQRTDIRDLESAAARAVMQCKSERDIRNDIRWVWGTKGQRWNMWSALQGNDFNRIRSIFSNLQAHDDQLRNRIYCWSGPEIRGLLSSWGNPGPVPPPQKEPREPHGGIGPGGGGRDHYDTTEENQGSTLGRSRGYPGIMGAVIGLLVGGLLGFMLARRTQKI